MAGSASNGLTIAGAVVVVAGILALAIPAFNTHDTKDLARVGDVKLQTTETQHYTIPPIAGGGVLALGIVLVVVGMYQRR